MHGFKYFINEQVNVDIGVEHEILNLYKDQARYKMVDISRLTGVSIAGIYRILQKYGINPHRRKSTDAHEVVSQYAHSGISASKNAELTGYSRRHIYNILKLR